MDKTAIELITHSYSVHYLPGANRQCFLIIYRRAGQPRTPRIQIHWRFPSAMPNLLSTPRDVGLTSDLAHFHFQECDLGYLKHSNLVWLLERKPCSVMTVMLSSAPSLAQLHLIHFSPHYGSCHLYFSRLMIFFFLMPEDSLISWGLLKLC